MARISFKTTLVAAFSAVLIFFGSSAFAKEEGEGGHGEGAKEEFNAGEAILHHIADSHEWHFFSLGDKHISLPLPVIVYSPERGLSIFSSSHFHHGEEVYNGYKLEHDKVIGVKEDGSTDESVNVYDFSMTKNVVQMILAVITLIWVMTAIGKKYTQEGAGKAPSGFQNAIEPVITFVRDDVARPNLGHKYKKYLPYLLTVFFFILINNLFGLLPGAANVTGNIAFTALLALVSFIVIMFSTNSHFWGHIFWPPNVPLPVKIILIPVELMGVFIKPVALMIRLFANMTAGHIVILSFVSLIFIFGQMSTIAGWGFSPVSIAFSVFIYLIEILVAFIQAFIFTTLTAVFIGQAFEGEHHAEGAGHHEALSH
ncbi:F0F1 ATP synthase subunit A [Flavihumibacter profundi]|jgi:F-type H+-transporting ATPase subunit a|uniref:F0F1 ATP synthase subunit A n=1 Tax=Flavihumibacter profundi TaxID=2716883 RepID=UPI001CC5EA4F|nr:F0F1 ATP synthase subunit A [Flavihumibacter profundi]MBZ5858100.1 F0F1 ATP synthase subunit A [Flavihumibacter profundi]